MFNKSTARDLLEKTLREVAENADGHYTGFERMKAALALEWMEDRGENFDRMDREKIERIINANS